MNPPDRKNLTGPLLVLALCIAMVAMLRYAQEFFLPLVLAGLLSFLFSPLVRRLERWHLGRIGAVLVTAAMAFVLIGGLTYLVTSQFLDLAGSLPKYRANLITRVTALKTSESNPLRLAVQTISEVTASLNKQEGAAQTTALADKTRPVRVEVVETAEGSIQMLMGMLWPVVGPLGNAAVVMVIAIFMLLAGQDLRDRLIHLMGRGRLRVTTQALDDIAQRIRGYLRALLLVNASFGLAIGVGLYFIGIPNAVFWGLLATVLRFLPYIGPWIAAAFPIALSMAVFDSWTQPLLVISLFVVCELISNNVIEPWLYGTSTEISPLAVIVSALFWTWLWGGVGLVLATPLTVCLAVMGDKPSISPGDRLYQRLLALNEEDATDIIEQTTREHSTLDAFDDAVLPALRSIEADFRAGVLSDVARTDACHILRQIIADIGEPKASATIRTTGRSWRPTSTTTRGRISPTASARRAWKKSGVRNSGNCQRSPRQFRDVAFLLRSSSHGPTSSDVLPPCQAGARHRSLPPEICFGITHAASARDAIQEMNMSTKKKATHAAGAERDTNGHVGSSSCAAPCSWLDQAEEFGRREPVKAVACAFSAGLLLHLLPTRATTAVVLSLARPVLLCLGLLKVWELSSCNTKSKL